MFFFSILFTLCILLHVSNICIIFLLYIQCPKKSNNQYLSNFSDESLYLFIKFLPSESEELFSSDFVAYLQLMRYILHKVFFQVALLKQIFSWFYPYGIIFDDFYKCSVVFNVLHAKEKLLLATTLYSVVG